MKQFHQPGNLKKMSFLQVILLVGFFPEPQLGTTITADDFELYSCPSVEMSYTVSKYTTDAETARAFCLSHGAVMPMFQSNLQFSEVFKCLNRDYSGHNRRISFLLKVKYTTSIVPILSWEDEAVDMSIWVDSDPNGDCESPSGVEYCCAKLTQRESYSGQEITGTVVDSADSCGRLDEHFLCMVPADVQILGDECALDLHSCSHTCSDALFGYTCSCPGGYTLSTSDSHTCIDVDECQNNAVCDQVCVNVDGSYSCDCFNGYSSDEHEPSSCKDDDECFLNPNSCDPYTETCTNIDGGFLCQCLQGYRNNSNLNGSCVDIDECHENNDNSCLDNACVNTAGSFKCACANGYYGDGITNCLDVDECANVSLNTCNQKCINFPGGFNCSCYDGYIANNGTHCIDIDECNMTTDVCNQTCVNTKGSYSCACSAGFSLSNNSHDCLDIDECKDNATSGGLCDQICTNTIGSYHCSCSEGYVLNLNATCEQGCTCSCHTSNDTIVETSTEAIRKHLAVERQALSSYTRAKTSASDTRTSAQTLGYFGLAMCISSCTIIVLSDLASLKQLFWKH